MLNRCSLSVVFSFLLGLSSVAFGLCGLISLSVHHSWVWEWILWKGFTSEFTFTMVFDWVSLMFFSLVSLISCSVMYYSESYMSDDYFKERFTYLVFFFVLSMFFMVFSINMVSIMLGWDGLGVVSYILVIHYQNEKSESAGMITALSNRVGDAAILLTIGVMVEVSDWNIFSISLKLGEPSVDLVGSLVVLAAITKSAQIPFSAWLPAAMAAPTPVSALVHSSTLVTAGVYLMIRFFPLIDQSGLKPSLLFLGGATTLMASVSANLEQDLKKVIALSTLSQLGLMVMSLGLGLPVVAYFHMMTHAMFKALLFMCGGKLIHESKSQDGRFMGGMGTSLPYTSVCMSASNLALCGFPFLAGFYSKDLLVEMGLFQGVGPYMFVMLCLAVGLSASYSVRFIYCSLIMEVNQKTLMSVSEEDKIMMTSKVGLLALSVLGGSALSYLIFPAPYYLTLPLSMKMMAFTATLTGAFLGGLVSSGVSIVNVGQFKSMTMHLLTLMWFLPALSGSLLSAAALTAGASLKKMDQGWFELAGGQGIYLLAGASGGLLSSAQFNSIKLFLCVFGVLVGFSLTY